MSPDSRNRRGLGRSKETASELAAEGLSALVPGTGLLAKRLVAHVRGMLADRTERRLEQFCRGVFEGELSEEEKQQRFRRLGDDDFAELVRQLVNDVESEKVDVYGAAYIHLVEGTVPQPRRRDFVHAVHELRLGDLRLLADLSAASRTSGVSAINALRGVLDRADGASVQRLILVGALDAPSGTKPAGPNDLGELLIRVVGRAIPGQ